MKHREVLLGVQTVWLGSVCETQGSPAWCADCLAGVSLTVKHREVLLGVGRLFGWGQFDCETQGSPAWCGETVWLGSV